LPANIDSLYQEMGRAGRDGDHSTCLMLYSKKDKGLQSFFIQNSTAPKPIKDARWRNLETLVNYAEVAECRHAGILLYYRDSQRLKTCGHCDVCDPGSARRILEVKIPMIKLIKGKMKKLKSDTQLLPAEEVRFDNLRKWRKKKAAELDIPAFVVFGDKTLIEVAQKNPKNLEDLKDIYGIGETKLEKFGWDLLAELSAN
jgi:ATP-dependent DNA helicase RecQ